MHQTRAATATDQKAQAVGGEYAIAWRIFNSVLEFWARLVEISQCLFNGCLNLGLFLVFIWVGECNIRRERRNRQRRYCKDSIQK